jgi:hypothetical protein
MGIWSRPQEPSEPNGYLWVEHNGAWWPTLAGRWTACPTCDRPFTYREFAYGSSGLCATCRPDLLPAKPPKPRATKKGK